MHLEHWIYTIPLRLRSLFRSGTVDAELEEELEFHLQRQVDIESAKGLSPEEARYAAQRTIGSRAQIKEECRDMRKWNIVDNLLRDVRYAVRSFARSPVFTTTAVLSLALGIGANTAIFSLIDAVLLKNLPVIRPDELAVLTPVSRDGKPRFGFSYPAYIDLRNATHAFSGLLAVSGVRQVDAEFSGGQDTAQCKVASGSYFSVLGINPLRGRIFNQDDDAQAVVVLSARYWKRNFDASDSALGRKLMLEGVPFAIVGVAPPEFFGESVGEEPDLWASMAIEPAQQRYDRGFGWLNLMARLKPNITQMGASAELNVIVARTGAAIAPRILLEAGGRGFSALRDRFSDSLRVLMAVVAVVLLIACANLASLLLARAASRQREIATRLAIGASRGRIIRQLLTESLLLSLMGGVLGVLFALSCGKLLADLILTGKTAVALQLSPDLHMLLFTTAVSLVAGVLFGLAPALQAVRRDIGPTLKMSARNLAGRQHQWRLKDALLVAQVAMSLLLLVAGGLFIRTLRNLKLQDTGYRADKVLIMEIGAQRGYRPEWFGLIVQMLDRTRGIPGVKAASVSFNGTLSDAGSGIGGLSVDGYIPQSAEDGRARADWVGPGYFETVGVPVLAGRDFSLADNMSAQKVVIVNQTMARHYFGNRPPVGRRLEFNKQAYQIVGLVRDAKYIDLRAPSPRLVYFSALQRQGGINSLEVRSALAPLAIAGAVRAAVRELDPLLRIGEVTTMARRIDRKLTREHLIADLTGFFAGLTLLLVAIGIYGTLAYAVAQRTNEIGIRMALGASPLVVVRMILRDILLRLAVGLIAGLATVLACGHALTSMLFGLKPTDSATIALAAIVLIVMALGAGYLPARRASRVDPLAALRFE